MNGQTDHKSIQKKYQQKEVVVDEQGWIDDASSH